MFSFMAFLGGRAGAQEVQTLETFRDRTEVLEEQVGIACGRKGLEVNPLKTDLADRMISKEGPILRLERELRAAARVVGRELEFVRERVMEEMRGRHREKLEVQHSKVEAAVKRLKQKGEGEREGVRSSYLEFERIKAADPVEKMKSDRVAYEGFRNRVREVSRVRKQELETLVALSSRVEVVWKKATACYCNGHDTYDEDRCPDDLEGMKKKMEYRETVRKFETPPGSSPDSGR
jgi:hypothetical protein